MGNSKGSRIRQSIDWVEAAADLAGNGLTMLRRLSEAVGTLTVVAGVAIVTMPTLAFRSARPTKREPETRRRVKRSPRELLRTAYVAHRSRERTAQSHDRCG